MDARKGVAAAIKDYLARERISREQFAFKTKLGKSTIDKLLIGLFSDRTLPVVEGHTKLPLRALLEDRAGLWAAKDGTPTAPKPLATTSLAVLPFANLGSDMARELPDHGIPAAHITALARLRLLCDHTAKYR